MPKVLIIGAGGVGNVVAKKCAQAPEIFSEICLASRTLARCEAIRDAMPRPIEIAQVDADDPRQVATLIEGCRPQLVINTALPYQDLAIMEACLATGVDYLDTANYEPPDKARFEYSWQWAFQERFRERGIMALLGCGFDPGVTNIFCAHALKHRFDRIEAIDIIDANAGDHGYPFATNFNPEINIREVTAPGRYYEDGQWLETAPLSVHRTFDFPEIGPREIYLLYHEELESLAKNIPGVQRIRFWMTFSDNYLTHLRVLENVGLTRIDPVDYEGHQIVPIKLLKALLPDPGSLGARTKGKTCIGCLIEGEKDGQPRRYYIYNLCDHQACYREVGSQAISYTTGVPAMIGGLLMLTGTWRRPGVWNVEELDPDPFMELLPRYGLPFVETDL
ncbi:MAG: saccharopine dehydrogenase family protein [Thermodesulfobacteriota bacterium]